MDFLQNVGPRRKKIVLSTKRKLNVLSALSSESKKCLCNETDDKENTFDHGEKIMAFLQGEQFHVENLKELQKGLIHPMLKESIEALDDICRLVDKMLSVHTDLCNFLICGKCDASCALKQLSSCLDAYVLYSFLISLEKNNFLKIIEMFSDIRMNMELLQEPIIYISRCEALFQNLYCIVSEETYHNALKAVEITSNNIQNELSIRENTIRILQIQRALFKREPKILSPGRTFIKEGILYKINHKGNSMKPRVFFLFSDILLCCKVLSKMFNLLEKDSLLFCSLFPLNMCAVTCVLGSSSQGTLFKVTCGTVSYLLISKIPGEAQSWFSELQVAIRASQKSHSEIKPKLNRRKNTGLKQKISPLLKQLPRPSENDVIIKDTKDKATNLQSCSKKPSLGKVMKCLVCINTHTKIV